jgi:hypothetical protein
MRKYNSETDYPVLLAAAKTEKHTSIVAIANGLQAAGIEWPGNFNSQKTPDAVAIDKDMGRAWIELGWMKAQ